MKGYIFAYTEKGRLLANKVQEILSALTYRNERIALDAADITEPDIYEKAFNNSDVLIFISATGIAVRKIAPFIASKLSDPAVIVIDELAGNVISLLSGHVGGGNDITKELARRLGAAAVITTATDINGIISIDAVAANNGLCITCKDKIKAVSGKLLKGQEISLLHDKDISVINAPDYVNLSVADDISDDMADVIISSDVGLSERCELFLYNRDIVLGVGCRRDKDQESLSNLVLRTLKELDIEPDRVAAVASIDVKKDEMGLIALARELNAPFKTYTAEELLSAKGEFEGSAFVEKTVGVSDVSARAAALCAGESEFILKKKKEDGMTLSVYKIHRTVDFDYTGFSESL